jgi:hypothetical protein
MRLQTMSSKWHTTKRTILASTIWNSYNKICLPVSSANEHKQMLAHAKALMEYRFSENLGQVAIHPRFNKLLIALRTAVENGEGSLVKEATRGVLGGTQSHPPPAIIIIVLCRKQEGNILVEKPRTITGLLLLQEQVTQISVDNRCRRSCRARSVNGRSNINSLYNIKLKVILLPFAGPTSTSSFDEEIPTRTILEQGEDLLIETSKGRSRTALLLLLDEERIFSQFYVFRSYA